MSRKVVLFDNGYKVFTDTNEIVDKNEEKVADLTDVLKELQFKLEQMSEKRVWIMCKPIIAAYEEGRKKEKIKQKGKLLELFELEKI